MLTPRSALTRRVMAALEASPSRIPVLLGGCGSGRTTVLQQLRDRIGRNSALYIDVERTATTPERFLRVMTAASPFPAVETAAAGARSAFVAALGVLGQARTGGGEPATFLLDEFLELRTFESFPGLRRVLHELADGLSASPNRFVLSSRYTARTLRLLRDYSARFEVIHLPPLTAEDALDILGPASGAANAGEAEYIARTVQALADGRPSYVRACGRNSPDARARRQRRVSASPLLSPDSRLAKQCGFCYELRLHRARGYGALKAILRFSRTKKVDAHRDFPALQRTPGSTKTSVVARGRGSRELGSQALQLHGPDARLWVRLHCRVAQPSEDDVARSASLRAARLPHQTDTPRAGEPAFAMVTAASVLWDYRDRLAASPSEARASASCSASFLLAPVASAIASPRTTTST